MGALQSDFFRKLNQSKLTVQQVINGEEVQILYGHPEKPVASLTKYQEKSKKRPLGSYKDYGPYWEDESFRLTPEWLFDDMDDLM